jgi:hypothetical protein
LYRSGEKTGDGSSVTCSWFSAKINKSSVFTWYGRWFTCLWSCTKNRLTYWCGLEEPQALLQRLGIFEPWLGTFCTKREPPRLQAPGAPQRPRRQRLAWCQIPKKNIFVMLLPLSYTPIFLLLPLSYTLNLNNLTMAYPDGVSTLNRRSQTSLASPQALCTIRAMRVAADTSSSKVSAWLTTEGKPSLLRSTTSYKNKSKLNP